MSKSKPMLTSQHYFASQEGVLEYLRLYSQHPNLYDLKHANYKNKASRKKSMLQIGQYLGTFFGIDNGEEVFNERALKIKYENLRCEYRKKKNAYVKSLARTGAAASQVEKPTIFYYDAMDSMLGNNGGRAGNETIDPSTYSKLTTTITPVAESDDEADEDEEKHGKKEQECSIDLPVKTLPDGNTNDCKRSHSSSLNRELNTSDDHDLFELEEENFDWDDYIDSSKAKRKVPSFSKKVPKSVKKKYYKDNDDELKEKLSRSLDMKMMDTRNKTRWTSFGDYVGQSLNELEPATAAFAQHFISSIILKANLGQDLSNINI